MFVRLNSNLWKDKEKEIRRIKDNVFGTSYNLYINGKFIKQCESLYMLQKSARGYDKDGNKITS